MEEEERIPQVTTGREWRKQREEGELETLPSGNVARLRKLSLSSLLKRGKIPDPLSGMVQRMMTGQKEVADTWEAFQGMLGLLEFICREAFLEPRIVDEPQADDEISMEDVDFDDRLYVLDKVQKEITLLTPFRPKPAGDVEALGDSEELQPEAEPDSGD